MTREKRLKLIRESMNKFRPLPDEYEDFVNNAVFKLDNIIIYNSKEGTAYCTGCKATSKIKNMDKKPKHNHHTTCKCCGRVSVAKSQGLIKNGFEVLRWSLFVDTYEDAVLLRHINHLRTYKSDGSFTQRTTEMLRTVLDFNKKTDFGFYEDGWSTYRNFMNSCFCQRSEHYEPRNDVMLYNTDLKQDLKGTFAKYSALELYLEELKMPKQEDCMFTDKHIRLENAYSVENYLCQYARKPYIEQLVKLGYINLAKSAMSEWQQYGDVFVSGKSRIHETLGLTRREYQQLKAVPLPTTKDVHILQVLNKNEIQVTNEGYSHIRNASTYDVDHFVKARKYMSEKKAIKSLQNYGGFMYTDYLDMANTLGWDMKSTMVLFPKDLKEAHDLAVKQFNSLKMKNTRKMLKNIGQSHLYDFETEDLQIVVPRSASEITREGQALHHCVGRYVEDVAKGKTMILFIRRKSNLKKPFYTMEWKDERVVQCYGKYNEARTEEVALFVKGFEQKMLAMREKTQMAAG